MESSFACGFVFVRLASTAEAVAMAAANIVVIPLALRRKSLCASCHKAISIFTISSSLRRVS
jgi:hypothetical protein